ncbi:Protein of unknown function [Propionibacterium freudenreichii subsp. freudenreichii]|uniref:Uncharacterized protein n=1 Tax=Propionibacterium freudenreichii subsp. freudenreichii TaxID=66712 RepID=A0A0B7NTB4_PROFF|nr:Protein of unknown function [Propionibacterium freudenreichii]CEP27145.1 Protein of unknown function [Propionibacterium freudenreichii subsp. freudenreichii]CEG94282.1 Protein of unknown function [Propionibacterium freudenreichii]CEG96548.1 Protein of unknown function [Propionibacterium freudenreichii]CEH03065.1 Protein of unknown function [Propionibacterium freudenreichii]
MTRGDISAWHNG